MIMIKTIAIYYLQSRTRKKWFMVCQFIAFGTHWGKSDKIQIHFKYRSFNINISISFFTLKQLVTWIICCYHRRGSVCHLHMAQFWYLCGVRGRGRIETANLTFEDLNSKKCIVSTLNHQLMSFMHFNTFPTNYELIKTVLAGNAPLCIWNSFTYLIDNNELKM